MSVISNLQTTKQPTKKQVTILTALYTFRFGTTDLLARTLGLKDGRYIYMRLEALVKLGYIGKQYDSSYKLEGRPATYYLLSPSFKTLKQQKNISPRTLRSIYKDKEASERFIAHSLAVFAIRDSLQSFYGKRIKYFTKSYLTFEAYDYFPKPLPDAYIRLTPEGVRPRDRNYFLSYLDEATPFFVQVRRLQKYIDYATAGEWEESTGTKLRGVLLVCESLTLLKQIRKKLAQLIDEDDIPHFYCTTLEVLRRGAAEDDEVWQAIDRPFEVFGLATL